MTALPQLIDCRGLMEELNVTRPVAERIMRGVAKVKVGRRVFVKRADVQRWLEERTAA